ncbi:MAG: SDR family oxidoreductase [Burkholderiaceae bacterium]|nr:SDR family oxidoreductase [Burkholderiaceae bacterium]
MTSLTTNPNTHPGLTALGTDLHQQTIAIVGVGGIGMETAKICAALGASLLLFDRAPAPSQLALPHPERHVWHTCDITKDADQRQLINACTGVDALIITSAIYPAEQQPDSGDEAGWNDWNQHLHATLEANLAAPMRICLELLPQMQARKQGRIVMTGSLAGRNGGLLSGPQYAASKGALHTFVRWLALRAAPHGISVNGVAPGVTQTAMIENRSVDASRIPVGRAAAPIEVARVISFLASPAASYMHGQIIDVNGGAWIG